MKGLSQMELLPEKEERNLSQSILSAAGSRNRAKTYQSQESKQELTVKGQVYGQSSPELLASFDPDTSSWRTYQRCLLETAEHGCAEFLETLPKSGLMRNGTLYRLETLMDVYPQAHRTEGSGSGLWPTPRTVCIAETPEKWQQRKQDFKDEKSKFDPGLNIEVAVHLYPAPDTHNHRDGTKLQANEDAAGTPAGKMQKMLGNSTEVRGETPEEWKKGSLNPAWVNLLMGLPADYLDLE